MKTIIAILTAAALIIAVWLFAISRSPVDPKASPLVSQAQATPRMAVTAHPDVVNTPSAAQPSKLLPREERDPNTVHLQSGATIRFTPAPGAETPREANAKAIATKYGNFFSEQHFTAEQQAKFRDLKLQSMDLMRDLFIKQLKSATPPVDASTRKIMAQVAAEESYKEFKDSLGATYGADVLGAFNEYETTYPARTAVNNLSDAVMGTDDALTPDQRTKLLKVIISDSRSENGQLDVKQNIGPILKDASAFLSRAQLERLYSLNAAGEISIGH